MSDAPQVKPGEWVMVGTVVCVVSEVRSIVSDLADLEVVHTAAKPVYHDVNWDGERWLFKEEIGGYATSEERLEEYVDILKAGRH